jgi:hypothetical protein
VPVSCVSRRNFLLSGGAALAASEAAASSEDEMFSHPRETVERIEKKRVLRAAQRYLGETPRTIVAAPAARSAGGAHDYFSEADYFWPDPKNPDGPYVNRDGESNPANFNLHRELLIRLGIHVPALVAAWGLTRRKEFAQHATLHLRAWFVEPASRMNPNLTYAQAVHGSSTGRSWGIIDTLHLAEVAQAAIVLHEEGAWSETDWSGVRGWFAEYLEWMRTSDAGRKERDAKNNHGTCWIVQVAAFARLVGSEIALQECRGRLTNLVFPTQIAPNGSFPLELERTKPYGYSLFNLDALGMAAHLLTNRTSNFWEYQLADGRSLAACFQFMAPYIANKEQWPYRRDLQYFDDLPVRQPSLLFAGLAYRKGSLIELWRRLDPDPTVGEVIRNHPYRQPLLWIR